MTDEHDIDLPHDPAFEAQLRRALRAADPPAGFAARVVARRDAARIRVTRADERGSYAALAASMLAMLAAAVVFGSHRLQQREDQRVAAVQLAQALQVTSRSLIDVQRVLSPRGGG